MRLTSSFTKRRADAQDRYRKETRYAEIVARYHDAAAGDLYDVKLGDGSTIYKIRAQTGNRFPYAVGNTVIIQNVGSSRFYWQIQGGASGQNWMGPGSLSPIPDWDSEDLDLELSALQDLINGKVDRAGDTMTGTLSVPDVDIYDGILYLGETSAEAWDDGHLRLSDPITGSKTLSELAEGGGGGGVELTDVEPQDVLPSAQVGLGEKAARDDHGHRGVGGWGIYGETPIYGGPTISAGQNIQLSQNLSNVQIAAPDALTDSSHTAIGDDPPHHARAHRVDTTDDHLLTGGSALQAVRLNTNGDDWEWFTPGTGNGSVTIATSFPGSPDNGDRCLRTDMGRGGIWFTYNSSLSKWLPDLGVTLEEGRYTLERILSGQATAAGALAGGGTMTLTRKNATDNKGCFTETGTWAENATYVLATGSDDNLYVTFYTSGGNVVLYQDTDKVTKRGSNDAAQVNLDGVAQTAWNQASNASYTLSAVTAGVHKVELNDTAADGGETTGFGCITYPVNGSGSTAATACYVGRSVAGDTCEILTHLDLFLTSFGIGRTTTASERSPYLSWGEGVIPRLPLGDGATDQTPARGNCLPTGLTYTGSSVFDCTTVNRREICPGPYYHASVKLQPEPQLGDTIKVGTTAGTRGFRVDSTSTIVDKGRLLLVRANSIIWTVVESFLVRITAVGGGSAFAVGDLAVAVVTIQITAASTQPYMVYSASNLRAVGLYKLEVA